MLAWKVATVRWDDPLPREPLRNSLGAVTALVGELKHPLDRLEVRARVVGDHEPAVLDGVAEWRIAEHPEALLGL